MINWKKWLLIHQNYFNFSSFGCPYSQLNMNKDNVLQDRLGYNPKGDGKKSPLTASPEQKWVNHYVGGILTFHL